MWSKRSPIKDLVGFCFNVNIFFITTHQQNCEKVTFSVVRVCLFTGGHVTVTHDALNLTIQGPLLTCSSLFNLNPTSQGPSDMSDLFNLDPTVLGASPRSHTVGKWSARIPLECFLVIQILLEDTHFQLLQRHHTCNRR